MVHEDQNSLTALRNTSVLPVKQRTNILPSNRRLSSPVQAVLFDVGDVLYDATVWRRWLLKLLKRIGLHTNYRAFYSIWDQTYMKDVYVGCRQFDEVFQEFLRSSGLSSSQIDEVKAASKTRRRELELAVRLFPGVKRTIRALNQRGFALGILHNSEQSSAELRERLNRLGLSNTFSTIVTSIEIGCAKPDLNIYLAALESLGIDASEAAFVGHNSAELGGAKEVGMQTIAFNFTPDVRADVFLYRFDELVDILGPRNIYAEAV